MPHPPFNLHDGTSSQISFDLAHLDEYRTHTNALLGNTYKRVLIEVHYSCHCWSRLPVDGEPIPAGYRVPDGSRHMPRDRIFTYQRYEMSKALPLLMQKVLDGDALISKTPELNILRIEKAVPIVGTYPAVDYFIFFDLEKKEPPHQQKYIKLFVQTAYPENALYKKVNAGRKPFNFSKAIGDCWKG